MSKVTGPLLMGLKQNLPTYQTAGDGMLMLAFELVNVLANDTSEKNRMTSMATVNTADICISACCAETDTTVLDYNWPILWLPNSTLDSMTH
jgi:hypothetical protein